MTSLISNSFMEEPVVNKTFDKGFRTISCHVDTMVLDQCNLNVE